MKRKRFLSSIMLALLFFATVVFAANKEIRDTIISLSAQQLNKPYISGQAGPDSFDCSGLVNFVYRKVNMEKFAYNEFYTHGATAEQQYDRCYSEFIAKENIKSLLPGDLVFLKDTYKAGISHVGIYAGGDTIIHASGGVNGDKSIKPVVNTTLSGWITLNNNFAGGCRVPKNYWPNNDNGYNSENQAEEQPAKDSPNLPVNPIKSTPTIVQPKREIKLKYKVDCDKESSPFIPFILLEWDVDYTNLVSQTIYRNNEVQTITTPDIGPSYNDGTVEAGETYKYAIKAEYKDGYVASTETTVSVPINICGETNTQTNTVLPQELYTVTGTIVDKGNNIITTWHSFWLSCVNEKCEDKKYYYSSSDGQIIFNNVRVGEYELSVWDEDNAYGRVPNPAAIYTKIIKVENSNINLGNIPISSQ